MEIGGPFSETVSIAPPLLPRYLLIPFDPIREGWTSVNTNDLKRGQRQRQGLPCTTTIHMAGVELCRIQMHSREVALMKQGISWYFILQSHSKPIHTFYRAIKCPPDCAISHHNQPRVQTLDVTRAVCTTHWPSAAGHNSLPLLHNTRHQHIKGHMITKISKVIIRGYYQYMGKIKSLKFNGCPI